MLSASLVFALFAAGFSIYSAIQATDYETLAAGQRMGDAATPGSAPAGAIVQVAARPYFTSVEAEGISFPDAFKVERRIHQGKHDVDDHVWVADDFKIGGWKVPARFLFDYPAEDYDVERPGTDFPAPEAWEHRGGPIIPGSSCFQTATDCVISYRVWHGYTPWTVVAAVAPDGESLGTVAAANPGSRLAFDGDLALMKFGAFPTQSLAAHEAWSDRWQARGLLVLAALLLLPQLAVTSKARVPDRNRFLGALQRMVAVIAPLALAQLPMPRPYGVVAIMACAVLATAVFIGQFFWPRRAWPTRIDRGPIGVIDRR